MATTAALVKELRELTGGGINDCKKALDHTNGNIDEAVVFLREQGLAKAAKKVGRVAAEGLIAIVVSDDQKQGIIIEINCETDFVARDSNFTQFCRDVAFIALANKTVSADDLLTAPSGTDVGTVDAMRQQLIVKIGENIHVRRCVYLETQEGILVDYIHGGRIGTLIELVGGDSALAKDIAMHIAASNPECICADDVDPKRVEAEKAIFITQAKDSGKPDEIIEKMIAGRMKKFVNEISLYGQPFVKNPDQTVGQLVKAANAQVKQFVRYEVGEGIEKKETDFAKEVMEQVRGE